VVEVKVKDAELGKIDIFLLSVFFVSDASFVKGFGDQNFQPGHFFHLRIDGLEEGEDLGYGNVAVIVTIYGFEKGFPVFLLRRNLFIKQMFGNGLQIDLD
jgi:hypothetical protein